MRGGGGGGEVAGVNRFSDRYLFAFGQLKRSYTEWRNTKTCRHALSPLGVCWWLAAGMIGWAKAVGYSMALLFRPPALPVRLVCLGQWPVPSADLGAGQ